MAKNTHKLPKAAWKKFGKNGQAMFNRLWNRLDHNTLKGCLGLEKLNRKELAVVRWNICWMSASVMKEWRGWRNHE